MNQEENTKVFTFGIPMHRGISSETFESVIKWKNFESRQRDARILQLEQFIINNGLEVPAPEVVFRSHLLTSQDALTERARNIIASRFVRQSDLLGDVLIFLDDDIIFDINCIGTLFYDCIDTKTVVGGIYTTRGEGGVFVPDRSCRKDQPLILGKGLTEMRYVSTGFMAVSRNVFDDIKVDRKYFDSGDEHSSFWDFFKTDLVEDPDTKVMFESEDWYFCTRASDKGYKILLDTRIFTGHVGTKIYTVGDIKEMKDLGPLIGVRVREDTEMKEGEEKCTAAETVEKDIQMEHIL